LGFFWLGYAPDQPADGQAKAEHQPQQDVPVVLVVRDVEQIDGQPQAERRKKERRNAGGPGHLAQAR
jgi:hypothetical protein